MRTPNRNEVIAIRNVIYVLALVALWFNSTPDLTQPGLHHLFPLWAQATEALLKWSALLLLHRLFVRLIWHPLTGRLSAPM